MVPDDVDVAVFCFLEEFVLKDLLGPKLVTAMNQGHFISDVREIQSLFHSSIAAADNRDFLLAVEEAVTGGAGRHALTLELLFGFKPQIHGRSASGNDQSVTGVFAVVAFEPERAVVQISFVDGVVHDAGFKTLGVLLHALH